MTKKELIDDIILRVTKGQPSDDLELEPSQIAFWFDLVARPIVADHLDKAIKNKETIDPAFIKIEDNKLAVVEDVIMLELGDDRTYITLSETPMNLVSDYGIIRVVTEEGTVVNNAPIEYIDTVNKLTFAKPSRENLLYSRVGQKLYIHGLKPQHISIISFSVYYIPAISITTLADSATVYLPEKVLGVINDEVEKIALRELAILPDEENDGQDDNQRTQ